MARRDDTPQDDPSRNLDRGDEAGVGDDLFGRRSTDGPLDRDGLDHAHDDVEQYDDDTFADHGHPHGDHDLRDDGYGHGVIGANALDPETHRRRRRSRAVIVALAALVLVAGLVVAFVGLKPLVSSFTASKDYDGPGSGSVTFTVKPDQSGQEIADGLAAAGVVMTAGAFTSAIDENPGAAIQPGQYTLKKQMKAVDALGLLRGQGRDVVKVTLREGLWKKEVFAALSKATGKPVSDYVAAEKEGASSGSLGLPSSAKGNVEGYLFPATYEFTPGTSATDQLRTLVGKSTTQLRELGVDDDAMERTVTVASIVEAEARLDADRPKVARVIENRLAKKMPLQLDSTVSYGVQKRAITTTDAERAAKNGYNTYVRPGLPAGPISNPGAESIKAAQAPAAGPWLYFVTVNPVTGETRFATTDAQHQANVALFQKWCQANPGKC